MKIWISIPAYNEGKTLGNLIDEIKNTMNKTSYSYKMSVVDDGSKDNTVNIAKSKGAVIYSHLFNMGLAETFRTEIKQFLNSKYDIFVHIDADGQYLPKEIPKLIKEIEKGYDLVLGSRFMGQIEYMPWLKKMGNKAFSKVISNITRFKISDCQTGFRAFNRKIAEMPINSNHTYTQEQIIRAIKNKFRIKEVPVYFGKRNDKSRLISHPFEYAFKAWINIFRIYRDYDPLKFFGAVGSVFLSIGFVVGLWLVYLFFSRGYVGHLPLTIFVMLMFVLGLQIIIFGFMADMNKK
jgi:glycosyltransferase involved in cell wall biosynthesis